MLFNRLNRFSSAFQALATPRGRQHKLLSAAYSNSKGDNTDQLTDKQKKWCLSYLELHERQQALEQLKEECDELAHHTCVLDSKIEELTEERHVNVRMLNFIHHDISNGEKIISEMKESLRESPDKPKGFTYFPDEMPPRNRP